MQKNQRKELKKLRKQAISSLNQKQFVRVPQLGGFCLIKKSRSSASISKKNQLNWSYETQVMNKRSLNSNLFENQILNFQKHV